jgi:hypothetical protein
MKPRHSSNLFALLLALLVGTAMGALFALLATLLINIVLPAFGFAKVSFSVVWALMALLRLLHRVVFK